MMRIVVIDDDPEIRGFLCSFLRYMGHIVTSSSLATETVQALPDTTNLVICDVGMPGLNGFGVAHELSVRLGSTPPRTLLMTSRECGGKLLKVPCSEVIGILHKPLSLQAVCRAVQTIEKTRQRCPALLKDVFQCPQSQNHPTTTADGQMCESPNYSRCSLFESQCGPALRSYLEAV